MGIYYELFQNIFPVSLQFEFNGIFNFRVLTSLFETIIFLVTKIILHLFSTYLIFS